MLRIESPPMAKKSCVTPMRSSHAAPSGRKSGEHRREGIVVRGDPGAVPGHVWDLPVLLTDLAGVPRSAWTAASGDGPARVPAPTEEEHESIVGHLRGLGYVD